MLSHCSGWKLLNDYDRPIYLQLGDEEVIAGIKSVHHNRREDRRFSVITCKIAIKRGRLISTDCAKERNYHKISLSKFCRQNSESVGNTNPLSPKSVAFLWHTLHKKKTLFFRNIGENSLFTS